MIMIMVIIARNPQDVPGDVDTAAEYKMQAKGTKGGKSFYTTGEALVIIREPL